MIKDTETTAVYFSELVTTDKKFAPAFNRIKVVLDKHNIPIKLLRRTKDIWCRDYMPIQINKDHFVQFRYEPSYLEEYVNLQSYPQVVCKEHKISPVFSSINLDGGNIVRWSDRVIISERIYRENPEYTDRHTLIRDIENLLEAEVVMIPDISSDLTGHADGMVRFVDKHTLIGNSRGMEYAIWVKRMEKVLREYGMEYCDVPFFIHKDQKCPYNALGCYVNYLEVGDLIILPIFEIAGNYDVAVVDLFQKIFPNRAIKTVNINEIGNYGGLLNCVTWTVLE